MSGEQKRLGGNRLRRKGAAVSLATITALGLSACSKEYCLVCYTDPPTITKTRPSPPPPPSYNPAAPHPYVAVPSLQRYKKGKVCPDGSSEIAACVVPIYREPKIPKGPLTTSNTVNVTNGVGDRVWPRVWQGDMNGPRDEVETSCQVIGEKVTAARDSDVWDVVKIPAEHANTPALYDALDPNATPKLGYEKDAGSNQASVVYAFMPNVLFDPPALNVPPCTAQQNPMDYQKAS